VQAAVAYATVNHQILQKLFGNLVGTFQHQTFNGGTIDGMTEQFYLIGLNLEYRFDRHFSAHVGYNYDRLVSDTGRDFDRNKVYVGLTATY
jgi:hypothetical protein